MNIKNDHQKLEVIKQLYEAYYNTDLSTSEFSESFYYTVGEVLKHETLTEQQLKQFTNLQEFSFH